MLGSSVASCCVLVGSTNEQFLVNVGGEVPQFFRLQRRPERRHLVATRGEHRDDPLDSQCGRDRLAAPFATLTVVSMAVDTSSLVKAFAICEVGCALCFWRACLRADRAGFRWREFFSGSPS